MGMIERMRKEKEERETDGKMTKDESAEREGMRENEE